MLLDTINCFPKVQGVSKKRKIQWHSKVRLLGGVYTVQVVQFVFNVEEIR